MKNLLICSIALIAILLGSFVASMTAQERFDTEFVKASEEHSTSNTDNLRDELFSKSGMFKRSATVFQIGLNFEGLSSLHAKNLLGVSIIDQKFTRNPSEDLGFFNNSPKDFQLIAVNTNRVLDMEEGYGQMTRVDPEIIVDVSTMQPQIEAVGNTGAVHGFGEKGLGVVNSDYVELRVAQGGSTYSRNTDTSAWVSKTLEYIDFVEDDTDPNEPVEKSDPTRSGELMVVGISIRRAQLEIPIMLTTSIRSELTSHY